MIKQQAFEKFCKEISFNIPKELETTFITKSILDHKTDTFILTFNFFQVINYNLLSNFIEKIKANFSYKTSLNFTYENLNYSRTIIFDYLNSIIFKKYKIYNLFNVKFDKILTLNEEGIFQIFYAYEHEKIKYSKYLNYLESKMHSFGFYNFKILLIKSEQLIKKEKTDDEIITEFLKNQNLLSTKKDKAEQITSKSYRSKVYKKTIKELYETLESNVYVEAYVVEKKIIRTKKNNYILTISVADNTEAIKLKKFFETRKEMQLFDFTNINDYIIIEGKIDFDNFTKEKIINPKKLTLSKDKKTLIADDETEKRIELSIRTLNSTMDGIKQADDFVKFAVKLGHSALAINDIDSIQSFPQFYNSLQETNIKKIFGASFSTIFKNNQAIKNLKKEQKIKDETYVVFDLETTGLSPIFDDIIEFGAQKIQNNKIIEEAKFFVKPNKIISEKITNITGITNKDVEKGKSEKEAIIFISEFMQNCTVVAHNAIFDMNFINEKIEKYQLERLDVQIVDTLIVSKILEPKARKFNLENLASRIGIHYDSTKAHRAHHDADVLSKIWTIFIKKLMEQNINSFEQLYNFNSNDLFEKTRPFEITILAKNQAGLKELFHLISLSSIEQYFNGPKLFFEDVLKKSKNLLLGSGTLKSLIMNEVFRGTRQGLRKYLEYFDYIEIIPPKNFSHWIARDDITKEELLEGLKILIYEAKKLNKKVVAVGDVRYLFEKEKMFHEIYIYAKGLKGVRHYLYKYDEKNPNFPTLNYLTTKEMKDEFLFLHDLDLIHEIVVANTQFIANQIDNNIEVIKKKLYTPKMENTSILLKNLVYKKAYEQYGKNLPNIVKNRIEKELEPLIKYGFDVIYWISHKLVEKTLNDNHIVGSRGSVGSSLVAHLSGITEVNPLPPHYFCIKCKNNEFIINTNITSGYDLPAKKCPKCLENFSKEGQSIPFETFLGFNADKIPDIDLNFSGEYQNVIHNEVRKWFGKKNCYRAGTISKTAAKTAFGYVLAWMEEKNLNYSNAFKSYLASKIIGTKRTSGQHPGGIIVIPEGFLVEDFSPVNYPANDIASDWKTTHLDYRAIHDNVLKLDLLGHADPTALKFLSSLTNINIKDIPFHDLKVIELFSSTKSLNIKPDDISGEKTGALGIPEFGTRFVRRILKKARVRTFADLISVSGLSHGEEVWTNNAEELITEQNLELKDVVSCRDDIMDFLMSKNIEGIVAFKIMENVRKGKGLSLSDEELLKKHNIPEWYVESLTKIKYMFPKAHAAAYVMMAWRIAWFKIYYPLEYYATYFTTRADFSDIKVMTSNKYNISKKLNDLHSRKNLKGENKLSTKEISLIPILEITEEMYARGFKISNVSIKNSDSTQWKIDHKNKCLIPPFIAIDGLGSAVAKNIIEERKKKIFISIEDVMNRTSINKTLNEKFIDLNIYEDLDNTNQISLFDL